MNERAMDYVLWIGGGSGAGKTSVARALSRRYDVELYAADARGYAHLARATGSAQPAESPDERWLLRTPEELVERFLAGAAEKFPLVIEDLNALRGGPLVVAEGPTMLPDLIHAHLASPAHALYLVPTDEFSERMLTRRGGGHTLSTSDPERAHAARLARNRILNPTIRERAASLGLPIVEVDGSLTLEQTERLVADRFAAALRAGPRATDGQERQRIRRRENATAHANATAYLHDIGVVDLDAAPPLPLGCECRTLGCVAEVRASPGAYAAVLDRPGRYAVAPGHAAVGEVIVGAAGDGSVVEATGDDGVAQGD
jgi:hypothetical protein